MRIKLIGGDNARSSNYAQSSVSSIHVQRMRWNYISDKWDSRTKHRDLKMGLVTKKTITRSIPGKWRNCMAASTVSGGINIWKVLLKKSDPNRKGFSFMIGVMDASKEKDVKDRVFSEVGGYGFVTTNGSLYHRGRRGMRYYDQQKKANRPLKNGDTIAVVLDYYRGTLSFHINSIDIGPAWSNIDKSVRFRLCIALRGCDEIKLMDQDQEQRKADERYKQITAQRLRAKQNSIMMRTLSRKKKMSDSKDLALDLIALPEEDMAQLQRKRTPDGSDLQEALSADNEEHQRKSSKRISSGSLFAKFRRNSNSTNVGTAGLALPTHQTSKSRSFNWRKRKQSQSDLADEEKSEEIDFDVSQSELVEHEYSPFMQTNGSPIEFSQTPNGGGNVLL